MTYDFTRRAILKSIGLGASATVLTPVLEQVAANASGDAARVRRQRFVFVLQSNGMNPGHATPSGVDRSKPAAKLAEKALADRTLHPALEPLTPFKNRLTLVQGLSNKVAYSDHSCNYGALGCYPKNQGPMKQTIDLALAEALPAVFPQIGLGYSSHAATHNNFSAVAPGQPSPVVCVPSQAFNNLFGSVAAGKGRQTFDLRTNLLEFMADDVRRSRQALVGDEKRQFDSYLNAFDSMHKRQEKLLAMQDQIRAAAPNLGDRLNAGNASGILDAQLEIATCALIAGLTNVVTLSSGGGDQQFGNYPEIGIPDLHHIGHGGSYDGKSHEACHVAIRLIHTRLIARLAKRLADTREGDGSMLDNTLIVYMSDSGDSHHPTGKEWPVVLLGNLGGKLRTGRYLDFPFYGNRGHRTLANLYCTLLHAVGKPRDQFGVPDTALRDLDQTGPLSELLA